MERSKIIVAAFDFDGTLTHRDTLISFLCYAVGKKKALCSAICTLPQVLLFFARLKTRQQVKESFLTRALRGKSEEELASKGEEFAEKVIPLLLKAEAMERLRWHKAQNHRCVLVSATLQTFLAPWCLSVGIEDLVCSRLAFDADRVATGKLEGLNCWGKEKVDRLSELLGPREEYELYAYGDSSGDRELLAFADHPFFAKFTSTHEKDEGGAQCRAK